LYSLHTNALDEAITTPNEDSVRRVMVIQPIIGVNTFSNPHGDPVKRPRCSNACKKP